MTDGSAEDTWFESRGHHFAHRDELVAAMEAWLQRSSCQTIGEVGSYGGRPWVTVATSAGTVQLNADTRRDAVERVVRNYRSSRGAPWTVTANRNGRANKVITAPELRQNRGWYAYLIQEAAEAGGEVC